MPCDTESIYAARSFVKHPLDVDVYGFIFAALLRDDAVLTAVVSIAVELDDDAAVKEAEPLTLLVNDEAVNDEAFEDDNGRTVAAGHAIRATASGGKANVNYKVTVTADLSDGARKAGVFRFKVRA